MHVFLITGPMPEVRLPGVWGPPVRLPLTEVQWDRELVLVADLGEQRSGGYQVRHLGTRVAAGAVEVQLQVSQPAAGAMAAAVITHPACVVRLPRGWARPGGAVRVIDQDGAELARVEVPAH